MFGLFKKKASPKKNGYFFRPL